MQRRRIAVVTAVVAATGAAVAFTLPSMAGTTPARGPARAAATGDVAPQLLAAMKRDLGLDADTARARLQRAEWAGKTSAKLAAQTGREFGGAWLAADGTTLKVAVTDADAAGKVTAAGGEPVLVERSEQTLDAAKEKLDAATRAGTGDLTGWYVDVATNKVVVVAKPGRGSSARALARKAGLDADAVTVKTSAAQPKPLFDVRGADPYFIQLGQGTARCSIGFAVEGGFVTAGHCGAEGDQTLGFNQQAQGEVAASVFPGEADAGFVAVNGDWDPRPVVNDFRGNELPVAGNTEAPVGAAICRSGSTTGTFCGRVLAKNQTVVYPEGQVTGLTRTDVCAEGGDSGGPWLSGDQAQGVTSGGSGDCTSGGETFFQPLNEILATNNLTLITSEGEAPPADGEAPPADEEAPPADEEAPPADEEAPPADEAPPAEDDQGGQGGQEDGQQGGQGGGCLDLPGLRSGSLAQQRTVQSGDAFRAGSGRQIGCLQVPSGADFDLFLQRFSLRAGGFQTVAKATGDGDKTLAFSGRGGTYRYVVRATSGSGDYNLSFATP